MADIGEELRSARQAKGMSVEDIEHITKIQRRYLTAIENNQFDLLPGDFYVRAFIKQYAQVVDLDGNELLADFNNQVPEAKPDKYVENSLDNKQEEVRRTTHNKKEMWQRILPKAAGIIVIFIALFIIYVLYSHFSNSGSNQQAGNQTDSVAISSAVQKKAKKKKKKKMVKKPSLMFEKLAENKYHVKGWAKVSDHTLKLATGETPIYATILVDGQARWRGYLPAKKDHVVDLSKEVGQVTVRLSNTKSAMLTLGGKKVKTQNAAPAQLTVIRFIFGKHKELVAPTPSYSNSQTSSKTSTTTNNTQKTQQQQTTTTNRNQGANAQSQPQHQVQSKTPVTNNQTGQNTNQGQSSTNTGQSGQTSQSTQTSTDNSQGQGNGGN